MVFAPAPQLTVTVEQPHDEPELLGFKGAALIELHDDGADAALVSRADAGALALINEQICRVGVPLMTVAATRGAGDSMTAGMAAVLAHGGDLTTAARTGAAAGAPNVTRHGLGTGHVDAVQVLTERVELTPIEKV
jgi:1-phosphofructokinase